MTTLCETLLQVEAEDCEKIAEAKAFIAADKALDEDKTHLIENLIDEEFVPTAVS